MYSRQGGVPRRAVLRRAQALIDDVDRSVIPVAMPGMNDLARVRDRARCALTALISQRAGSGGMPRVVALAGSSGVGKSALFNALAMQDLSPTFETRPGTSTPVALVNPEDEEAFAGHPLASHVRAVVSAHAQQGIVLIDCPAWDWAYKTRYSRAQIVLDYAFSVIFVTTIYRYGDAAAWDILRRLSAQSVRCSAVLNRVPAESHGVAARDFQRLWSEAGFSAMRVAIVHEGELGEEEKDCENFSSDTQEHMHGRRKKHLLSDPSLHSDSYGGMRPHTNSHARHAMRVRRKRSAASGRHAHRELTARPLRTGVGEIRRWCSVLAHSHSVYRSGESVLNQRQLVKDINILADSLDSARNTLVDLADRAHVGAAAPLDKLATNVSMGRFGQGAVTSVWQGLTADHGLLAGVQASARVSQRFNDRESRQARDAQLGALFSMLEAALVVAVRQGLTTAAGNIERSWATDGLDTQEFIAAAREHTDVVHLAAHTVSEWKDDVRRIAVSAKRQEWFGRDGVAGLIAVAASGVSGAMAMARDFGWEQAAWDAREALVKRIHEVMDTLVEIYRKELRALPLEDAVQLREDLRDLMRVIEKVRTSADNKRRSDEGGGITVRGAATHAMEHKDGE